MKGDVTNHCGYSLLKFAPFIRQVVRITAFRIHFNVESVSLPITDWTRPQRITARTRAETRVAGSRAQASEFYLGDNVKVLEIPATGVGVKFVLDIDLEFISPEVSCHIVGNLDGTLERLGGDSKRRRSLGIDVGVGRRGRRRLRSSCT